MNDYIQLENLSKQYDKTAVVNKISLQVKKGETIGLLGPNGAGKTTTIMLMSGQSVPTSGYITIDGHDSVRENKRVKSMVGIVPQEISLYDTLNAYDNLHFFGAMYGLNNKERKQRIDWLLDKVGLKDKAKQPIKQYSGGMKRRINIAAALVHDPPILFMDEPTVGIDPQSRNKIYELIKELKNEGKTIIYTTHYMEEAENLCDRLAIIDNGALLIEGTVDQLIGSIQKGIVEIELAHKESLSSLVNVLKNKSYVTDITDSGNKLTIVIQDEIQTVVPLIIKEIDDFGFKLEDITIMPPTLESLFLFLTGKQLRD